MTAAVLVAGLAPLPAGWALTARESLQSTEPTGRTPPAAITRG